MVIKVIIDRDIYEKVICGRVRRAKKFVWLATSDLKDLHVDKANRKVPFLEILSDLICKNVEIRLLHAKEPGPIFRKDFDRYPNLLKGLERILCPRVHFKSVIIDGKFAYTGSANLTGAGMGAKSKDRRNFESGVITTDQELIDQITAQFDAVWMGGHCSTCRRKEFCPDHHDLSPK